MRGEDCLTDLQPGRYHHVLSGGRRWALGLGRAAAMVWQLAEGTGGLRGMEELGRGKEEASGGKWDGTGVAGPVRPPVPRRPWEARAAGSPSVPGRVREGAAVTARARHVS